MAITQGPVSMSYSFCLLTLPHTGSLKPEIIFIADNGPSEVPAQRTVQDGQGTVEEGVVEEERTVEEETVEEEGTVKEEGTVEEGTWRRGW